MPSSTLSRWELVNIGPLTTTFTAPSSCVTPHDDNIGLAWTESPGLPLYRVHCDTTVPRNCDPGGSTVKTIVESKEAAGDPYAGLVMPYHSPGNICPQDWATVGVAKKDSDGSLSATGIFTGPASQQPSASSADLRRNPKPNVLAEALDGGETAVLCCPSDFTVDEMGQCYSNFPIESYSHSTACAIYWEVPTNPTAESITFTYNGEVYTDVEVVFESARPESEYFTTIITFDSDPDGHTSDRYTGHVYAPMVTLVNRGEEEGDDDEDSDSSESNDGDDDESAASADRGSLIASGLVTLMTIWVCRSWLGAF